MLKQGYDHFEVTHRQPKVDVCEKHYVFDAESTAQFSPTERCPAYRVPEDIAAAVRDKHRRDDIQTAELISRGTPAVPVTTGIDGGMNPIFFAAVKSHGPGVTIRTTSGTIPAHVNPPAELAQTTTAGFLSFASTESRPAPAPRSLVQADSTEGSGNIGSFSGSPFGSKSEEAARNETAIALVSPPPSAPPRRRPSTDPKSRTIGLLRRAAPTVPAGSFDNRYASWR
jgi:hypothetical protein